MSLKLAHEAASTVATPENNNSIRFATTVQPVIQGLAAMINEDPNLRVEIKVGGDNDGFFSYGGLGKAGGRHYYWAFDVAFYNKGDNSAAGTTRLHLAGNVPEIGVIVMESKHLKLTDPFERRTMIQHLVTSAARSMPRRVTELQSAETISRFNAGP